MKVKQATAYALHSLIYMIRHVTQLPISSSSIAKAEGIPAGYLAKIFQKLSKANIVKTSNGSQRGYVFARPPKEMKDSLVKTSLETAAWSHPKHRFNLPIIKDTLPSNETASLCVTKKP